jgi:hypothetical protein
MFGALVVYLLSVILTSRFSKLRGGAAPGA